MIAERGLVQDFKDFEDTPEDVTKKVWKNELNLGISTEDVNKSYCIKCLCFFIYLGYYDFGLWHCCVGNPAFTVHK
jgi:hypothetical protein